MKLCKDCRFVERYLGRVTSYARCQHTRALEAGKVDKVLGGSTPPRQSYASVMRLPSEACGPDARLFRERVHAPLSHLSRVATAFATILLILLLIWVLK